MFFLHLQRMSEVQLKTTVTPIVMAGWGNQRRYNSEVTPSMKTARNVQVYSDHDSFLALWNVNSRSSTKSSDWEDFPRNQEAVWRTMFHLPQSGLMYSCHSFQLSKVIMMLYKGSMNSHCLKFCHSNQDVEPASTMSWTHLECQRVDGIKSRTIFSFSFLQPTINYL